MVRRILLVWGVGRSARQAILLAVVAAFAQAGWAAPEAASVAGGARALDRPAGVSPGGSTGFELAEACPSFSWTAVEEAGGYELLVVEVAEGAAEPALEARVPAGALSWTPAADRCLAPGGRYAWTVRPLTGEWSEALLFTVAPPAAMDLEGALAVLREALASEPEAAAAVLSELAGAASPAEPDGASEAVEGPINADTLDFLDSTQFLRSDVSATTTGTLTVDPAAGSALVTGSGDAIDLGGDLLKSGTLFLHNHGNANLALGANALAANTTGANNLAFGADALDVNTTGGNNTALGNNALGANVAGSSNVGIGRNALLVSTASNNVAVGAAALDANTTGTSNTALGNNALGTNVSGTLNTAVGRNALLASTSSGNTALGAAAADATTSGGSNTALGSNALGANETGANNTAVGASALLLATGSGNIAVGNGAGSAATTGSNDIYVGHSGVAGESGAIRLGTPGTQTATFIAGVSGVTTAGAATPVLVDASGQLGTSGAGGGGLDADTLDGLDSTAFLLAATDDWVNETGDLMTGTLTLSPAAGNALTTTAGDLALHTSATVTKAGSRFLWDDAGNASFAAGRGALASNTTGGNNTAVGTGALDANATGSYNVAVGKDALGANTACCNTAVGALALGANTTGTDSVALGLNALGANTTASGNTAVGSFALQTNTTGSSNVALGRSALSANTTASKNTAVGTHALLSNSTGYDNVAVGYAALQTNTAGYGNVALGKYALLMNTMGTGNIAIGSLAGGNVTTTSNNIFIDNDGVAGDASKIRIGDTQTEAFIRGIHGNTTSGGIAVFVNSSGDLGTSTSSRRFKEDIAEVGAESERLLALRPVSFRYTKEAAGEGERPLEYGLIAEEVAEVFPELVAYDEEGAPYTVRYHLLVPLLLNELQRERVTAREQGARVEEHESTIAALLERIEALERQRGRALAPVGVVR